MVSWFSYKNYFAATTLALLLWGGCTDETARYRETGSETGKVVTVSLKVSLPPALEPSTKASDSIPASRSNAPGAPFQVSLEHTQPEPAVKASDGTTPLYNMWLFQFNADGSINGEPHHLTDGVTPINDMATLEVPLVVATDQTLYLVVMGPRLDHDFSGVSTLAELKKTGFEYLTEENGRVESLITTDNDIPFAGSVSGITVVDIDGGNQGLIEYNTPTGFTGGIEIRRLMAKITLRYKFDVPDYTLQGMKLLNVNRKILLENPDALNTPDDSYAALETETGNTPETDGDYATYTWYVAQNRWGTITDITTESERYNKVEGTTTAGKAPKLGTQIEAWTNSNTDPDQYAIYQMYVGNNNTNNFDVEANHFYNLRTTINTAISSAKNDQRIRTYAAEQRTEFHASALIKGDEDAYNKPGDTYDLDAHPDSRQITVQSQGRNVNIGIYTDEACTVPAHYPAHWLQLSFSSNYTEAINNLKGPLATTLSATAVLPTQLKFYLYSDEYIYGSDNKLPAPDQKRSLYIKITTATTGEGGTVDATHIYRIDQRPAVYCGRFGGPKTDDGRSYTQGLVHDRIAECSTLYTEGNKSQMPSAGYYGLDIVATYGADDMNYGKEVTRKLAENPSDLTKDSHFLNPPLKEAGKILLYQYTYYNTFAARFCYDRNRDKNGNGKIDDNEFLWYLPAANQLLGAGITTVDIFVQTWSTTAYNATGANVTLTNSGGMGNEGRSSKNTIRCVRDIDIPTE